MRKSNEFSYLGPEREKCIAQGMFYTGAAALLIGLGLAAWSLGHQIGSEVTQGTVVELERRESQGKNGKIESWYPVIEYQVDGVRHRCTSLIGGGPASYRIGDRLDVSYRPSDPGAGCLDSFVEFWLASVILGPVGVLFTFIGILLLRWVARNERDSDGWIAMLF